jgi:hypothetical protein
VIKLNDTEVGDVPLSAAPGPFTQVELVIVIKERSRGDVQPFGPPGGVRAARTGDEIPSRGDVQPFGPPGGSSLAKKSPQITSVQVVPLEEAP